MGLWAGVCVGLRVRVARFLVSGQGLGLGGVGVGAWGLGLKN